MPGAFDKERRQRRMEKLRLSFERWLLRGLHYRLLLAAMAVAFVAFAGGVVVWIFDPGFSNVAESFWWAFLRLTDPGYLGEDVGIVGRTVSTILTVLGFMLFVGLLIAILTQWMNNLIETTESGVRPVHLRDHILILGWTHRTPSIALELLRTRGRVTRFLEARNASKLRIVILAEGVDRDLIEELKEALGEHWNDRQVLLRGGSPLKLEHLERVSFDDAAAIILPGEDFSQRSPGVADADTLKTLLSIAKHTSASTHTRPLAVAALYDEKRADMARTAYGGDTEIIAGDRIICRFIAQSVRQPGMWSVLSQLLSLDEGNALYPRTFRGPPGTPFAMLDQIYPKAIPIGVIPAGSPRPLLNPDPRREVNGSDVVVLIARAYADCTEAPLQAAAAPAVGSLDPAPAAGSRTTPSGPERVLVLGWSRKVPTLLREFMDNGIAIDVVGLTPLEDRAAVLEGWPELESQPFRQIRANFLDIAVLESLEPWCYDSVVILTRARMGDEAHADAATITAYLSLQQLMEKAEKRPTVLVEVLEQENSFLFDAERDDVLMSPLIISYLLSQVSLRRELGAIFSELARAGGPQIELRPLTASEYSDTVSFIELAKAAARRREIALGRLTAEGEVLLNPDKSWQGRLSDGDQLIILTTERERL